MRLMTLPLALIALLALVCPAWSINGVVVDSDGKPVAGARVYTASHKNGPKVTITYADKDGKFTYSPLTLEFYFIATAPGKTFGLYYWGWPREAPIKLVLWPESKLRGRVVDEQDRPVAGATVTLDTLMVSGADGKSLSFAARDTTPDRSWTTTSGMDGSFTLQHMPNPQTFKAGSIWIKALKDGWAEARAVAFMTETDRQVKLTMARPSALEGTLYLPGGNKPASEGTIFIRSIWEKGRWDSWTLNLDKRGSFSLKQIPPGRYDITMNPSWERVFGPDGRRVGRKPSEYVLPAVRNVQLLANRTTKLNLTLDKAAMISGRVIDRATGEPVPQTIVNIRDRSRTGRSAYNWADIDEKGEFTAAVAPGSVALSAHGGNRVAFTVASGEQKTGLVFRVPVQDTEYNKTINYGTKPPAPGLVLAAGTYNLKWDPELDLRGFWHSHVLSQTEVKEKVRQMPAFSSNNPRVMAYRLDGLDDSGLLFAGFDTREAGSRQYDTVYIDANRNRDLADEEPLKLAQSPDSNRGWVSPWVEVQARQGSGSAEGTNNPVQVQVTMSPRTNYVFSGILRKGGWRGTVGSNQGDMLCAVVDNDGDGIYGGPVVPKPEFNESDLDMIFLDITQEGKLGLRAWSNHAIWRNEINMIAGRAYEFTLNDAGNRITIAPSSRGVGRLQLRVGDIAGGKTTVNNLRVSDHGSMHSFTGLNGEPATVPAGRYKIDQCFLEIRRGKDEFAQLGCKSELEAEVKPNELTVVDVGGDFAATISPDTPKLVFPPHGNGCIRWDSRVGGVLKPNTSGAASATVRLFDQSGKLVRTIPRVNGGILNSIWCFQIYDMKPGHYVLEGIAESPTFLGKQIARREVDVVDKEAVRPSSDKVVTPQAPYEPVQPAERLDIHL